MNHQRINNMDVLKKTYTVETVGSHMEVVVPIATPDQTIGEIETLLKNTKTPFATVNIICVQRVVT